MRKILLLVICLSTLGAGAQGVADVEVVSFTANKTSALTGDQFMISLRLRNNGPAPATDVNVNIANSYGMRLLRLASTASPGWACSPVFPACFAPVFPAGVTADLTMILVAPAVVRPDPFRVTVHVSSATELNSENNRAELSLPLQASTRRADLSIALNAPPNPVPQGTPVTLTFAVRNEGPDALDNIEVVLRTEGFGGTQLGATYSGGGWTCVPLDSTAICRRATLTAGATAPLELRFTTTSGPGQISVEGAAYANQPHVDPDPSNDMAFRTLFVGSAANWRRVLLPVTDEATPGAGGAVWTTEIKGMLETNGPEIVPEGCGPIEDPCSRPPVNEAFDVRDENLIVDLSGSQFIYVSAENAENFRVSTRVYDAARDEETAGAFVPSPRDDDFSSDGFSIVGIPAAPQFRSMLRIYDYDAIDDMNVLVELFDEYQDAPFSSSVRRLEVGPDMFRLTTALLPSHPATARVDLTGLIPAGVERVRVSVRPLASEVRIWGFVSITNNETHHVTVVAP